MQAAIVDHYGPPDVVRIADVPRPEPRAGQVLVRILAVAVNSGDARIRAARFPPGFALLGRLALGVTRPRRQILGNTLSGVVEAAGPGVSGLKPGDEVCGMTGPSMGAHAQFLAIEAARLVRKPAAVSHDDAAGVLFGGTTALFFLRDKAKVGPGRSLLVNGASGAVGTNAVQLGRHFGASVTGVTSTANAELVTRLGAAQVIDYVTTDLFSLSQRFDVVLDAVGNLSIPTGRRLLRPGGVLVLAVAGLGDLLRARGDVVAGEAPQRPEDFALLLRLVAEGALTVVQDQAFDLADIAQAHRRVDSGRKRGNTIVHPWPASAAGTQTRAA